MVQAATHEITAELFTGYKVEKLLAIEALESSPAKQMDVAAVALRLGAPLRRMAMTVWPQDTVQFAFLFQESMH